MSKHKLEYKVIQASREDLDQVININLLTLPENYPRFFFEYLLERYPKCFLVAKINNHIVGYIMCRVENSIVLSLPIHRVKRGHVVSIAVLPGYRRRGIGTKLLKEAIRALKEDYNCKDVYLEVRVSNYEAIRLYEKLGFKISEVKKGYYKDGEDAYVMTLNLR